MVKRKCAFCMWIAISEVATGGVLYIYKKDILQIFSKFTGKIPGMNLFFNKVTGIRPATLFKRETPT